MPINGSFCHCDKTGHYQNKNSNFCSFCCGYIKKSLLENNDTESNNIHSLPIEKIQKSLNLCLHCGQKPKVYHRDYEGDVHVGDEYLIECSCGIQTAWLKLEKLLECWNSKPTK